MGKRSHAALDSDGASRHPTRSRRKAKRRPRSPAVWETPTYWNLLTFPIFLLAVLLSQALVMSPLFVDMPFLERHSWLAVPCVLGWLSAVVFLQFRPFMHLRWNISGEWIMSAQPAKGTSYSRTWPNADFVAVEPWGPLIRVRLTSGAIYIWPRWVWRDRRIYVFELLHGRLRLSPLRSEDATNCSSHTRDSDPSAKPSPPAR